MTTERKHRELTILYVGQTKDIGSLSFTTDLKEANERFVFPFTHYVHGDDHFAIIEELKAELKEQCEINSIGQERELKLINEIAQLKSILLEFDGRTFSENQEIVQLKADLATAVDALAFYGDKQLYFMKDSVVNLQQTTAIFKVDDPSKLPTEFKSKIFECSARLKVDQGKRAREALAKIETKV